MAKIISFSIIALTVLFACSNQAGDNNVKNDTIPSNSTFSDTVTADTSVAEVKDTVNNTSLPAKTVLPTVLIYNFHVTNRCPSCIAIEEATSKTLDKYFAAEVKQGRIKRYIVNVDEEANSAVSEKYQAFGSGLFVTRVFKGNETTTDLTGDGFKFARNKEDKFIEILKNSISEYLK